MSKKHKGSIPEWLGEECPKCNAFKMIHPHLYFYRCVGCGYQYTLDPVLGKVKEEFVGGIANE